MSGVVVVGGGYAGAEVVASLRMESFADEITMVSSDESLPYKRQYLSKDFLKGKCGDEEILIRAASFYADQGIRFLGARRAVEVDRAGAALRLDDGAALPYSALVLATGGVPRRHPDPVIDRAPNTFYLRSLADARPLRDQLQPAMRLAVVGGGYVGLEVAAAARQMGVQVTVIEAAERLLARVTSPIVSEFFAETHRAQGADVRLATRVTGSKQDREGRISALTLSQGRDVPVDLVVVGIGMDPSCELAEGCGLAVDDGVIVDQYCLTSDTRIYALGDCARFPWGPAGESRRLESIPNATAQAKVVAHNVLGGQRSYESVPWFWSEQYDTKIQSVGLVADYDDVVVRGDARSGAFSVFYLRKGIVIAADCVSKPRDFLMAKKLVASGGAMETHALSDGSRGRAPW